MEGGRLLQLAGMSGMAEKYYANVNDIPVTFTIDSQTGRPIACTMDLANTLQVVTNNVLQELNNEGTKITVEKYDVIMELSKWNETPTIEIPKEAQTAINYEQEITDMQKDAQHKKRPIWSFFMGKNKNDKIQKKELAKTMISSKYAI